jgi:D-alanine-D-alanine ligase
MSNIKKKVAIICGGRSLEYALSIVSAKNIASNLEKLYTVSILCIDKSGHWHYGSTEDIINGDSLLEANFNYKNAQEVHISKGGNLRNNKESIVETIDVVFPITNGIDGHQGAISGMMKLLDIPCVGSDVFETVVCIDKEITKSLLQNYSLPIVPYLIGRRYEDHNFDDIVTKLGLPFFIKPCRLSSSAGISKVSSKDEYEGAVISALEFDDKFLIEKAINGREIETGVIGNKKPKVSNIIGETVVNDYGCFNKSRGEFIVPASINNNLKEQILTYANEAYKVLGCKGFARIDFFLDEEEKMYINEATTLPIFTNESMFTKLWKDDIEEVVCSLVEMSFDK